jgi:recombination protein RecR
MAAFQNLPKSYPDSLKLLIEGLARFPGVGKRSAERIALAMLKWSEDDLTALGELISKLPQTIGFCNECGYFAESELCSICQDTKRDHTIICVVEEALQVPVVERANAFDGVYHVLGGRIVPLSGVGPEALRINPLHHRIQKNSVKELILATASDVEGEATASYLKDLFSQYNIEISRIASGLPVGADLSYADAATMAMAINARQKNAGRHHSDPTQ